MRTLLLVVGILFLSLLGFYLAKRYDDGHRPGTAIRERCLDGHVYYISPYGGLSPKLTDEGLPVRCWQ